VVTVVLIGPPAAGKTSVGKLLAQHVGQPFTDVDAVIEAKTGRSVAQIFAEDGEPAFRDLEATQTIAALAGDAVVALGGGAVTSASVREALTQRQVVWLDVSFEEALRRATEQAGQRPLLEPDLATNLATLMAARYRLYASASTWRVDTTGKSPIQVAEEVAGLLGEASVIRVATEQAYEVVVEPGALRRLAPYLVEAPKVALIASPALSHVTMDVLAEVQSAGAQAVMLEVPVGEAAKTPQALIGCWRALAANGFTRSDIVIGIGGGATTDLAGLVAATFLRGIAWVAVPTTVLGMVDAAVGGKTGIDIPEGKNLVGAFHEPTVVLADTTVLDGLPEVEVRAGLAEVAKVGFTDDRKILELIENSAVGECLTELIARAVRVKARVVADDLRERTSGLAEVGRERLNYGHTLAHAIEAHEHYTRRHGEAVAIGAVFAAEVAHRVLGLPSEVVDRHRSVFGSLGLPTSYDGASFKELRSLMARDKKARGARLRMVLLRDTGEVAVVKDPPEDDLEAAYEAISRARLPLDLNSAGEEIG